MMRPSFWVLLIKADICHEYHELHLWRKNCHVEKFQLSLYYNCGEIGNFSTCGEISVQLMGFYCNLCRFVTKLVIHTVLLRIFLPQFTRFHVEKNWAKRTFVEEKWQLSGLLLLSSIPSHLMRLTCCKTRNVMWIWVSMAKVGWEWGRVPRLGVFCQAPITLDFLPTPCSRPTPTLNHLGTQIRGRFENWRKTSNEITKCNINYAVFLTLFTSAGGDPSKRSFKCVVFFGMKLT